MRRHVLMAAALCLVAGCQETRVIEDNTATAKFMSLMGGASAGGGETSGAWQMTRNDQAKGKQKPNEPAAKIVKEADFSSYKFSTNMQVDEARARPGQLPLAGAGSATQPAVNGNPPDGPPVGTIGPGNVGPGGNNP